MDLGGLVEFPGSKSDGCFWIAAEPMGSSDYFNTCAAPPAPPSPTFSTPSVSVPTNYFSLKNGTTQVAVPALAQNSRATTGQAYAGILAYVVNTTASGAPYREYICQSTAGSLQAGKRYYGEFSAFIAPVCGYTVPRLGMAVAQSNTINYPNTNLGGEGALITSVQPVVSGNPNPALAPGATHVEPAWQRVGQVFTPTSAINDRFTVIIGNFTGNTITQNGPSTTKTQYGTDYLNTSYYYVDNVSLSPLTEAGPNATLLANCSSARLTLGTTPMPAVVAATYRWTASPADPTLTNPASPNPTVQPTQTTTYTLAVAINGQTYTSQAIITVGNAYYQSPAATYVAPSGLAPYELGTAGTVTTINASAAPYNGTVVFSGRYHVRGTLNLINGTFQLQPGTTFFVDGSNGQTFVQVANATCNVTASTLQAAACGAQWGGIVLNGQGILNTGASGGQRSLIRDAAYAVRSSAGNAYYLTGTDFVHNDYGLYEYPGNKTAQSGEGVRNCTFSDGDIGVALAETDYLQGVTFGGNYDAAQFSGNSFANLQYGLYVTAGKGHFLNNTFITCAIAGMAAWSIPQAGATEFRANTITVPSGIATGNPYGTAGILAFDRTLVVTGNTIQNDNTQPSVTTVPQEGIDFAYGGGASVMDNVISNLRQGIVAVTDDYNGSTTDMERNTLLNNLEGMTFYPVGTTRYGYVPVTGIIRCNSFFNSSADGSHKGIWIKPYAGFDNAISNNGAGNGNKFLAGQWTTNALVNDSQVRLNYTKYSRDEEVGSVIYKSDGRTTSGTVTGGGLPPANGCGGQVGVNAVHVSPTNLNASVLATKLDSLRLAAPASARQQQLLADIVAQPGQPQQTAALESYFTTATEPFARQTIGLRLLSDYRQQHDQANAARLRAALRQQRQPDDAELLNYLRFAEAADHLGNPLPRPDRAPAPEADLLLLRQAAASGTTTARLACRLLRQYEPTCACVLASEQPNAQLSAAQPERPTQLVAALGLPAYPNPASTSLHVPYTLPVGTTTAELVAYDALGRAVWHQSVGSAQAEAQVDVQGWAAGLYQLTLVVGGRVVSQQRVSITHN